MAHGSIPPGGTVALSQSGVARGPVATVAAMRAAGTEPVSLAPLAARRTGSAEVTDADACHRIALRRPVATPRTPVPTSVSEGSVRTN